MEYAATCARASKCFKGVRVSCWLCYGFTRGILVSLPLPRSRSCITAVYLSVHMVKCTSSSSSSSALVLIAVTS